MDGKISSRAFQRVFFLDFFGVLVDLLQFLQVFWKNRIFEFFGNWLTIVDNDLRLVANTDE